MYSTGHPFSTYLYLVANVPPPFFSLACVDCMQGLASTCLPVRSRHSSSFLLRPTRSFLRASMPSSRSPPRLNIASVTHVAILVSLVVLLVQGMLCYVGFRFVLRVVPFVLRVVSLHAPSAGFVHDSRERSGTPRALHTKTLLPVLLCFALFCLCCFFSTVNSQFSMNSLTHSHVSFRR